MRKTNARILAAVIILTGLWWLAVLWQNARNTMLEECEYDRRTRCPTECTPGTPTAALQHGQTCCRYPLTECSGIVDAEGRAYSSNIERMRLYFRHTAAGGCPGDVSVRYDGQLGASNDPYANFPEGNYCRESVPRYEVFTGLVISAAFIITAGLVAFTAARAVGYRQ